VNTLLPFYLFLISGAVLVVGFRHHLVVSRRRALYLGSLLCPLVFLIIGTFGLGFWGSFVVSVTLWLLVDRLVKSSIERQVNQGTLRLWLIMWLVEAALPLTILFAIKSQPLQRISLLVASLVVFAATLSMFVVFAPDLGKHA
jgi:hypothetical protein